MDSYYAILLGVKAGRFCQCFYRNGIFFQMVGITAERLVNHECQESSQDHRIDEIRMKKILPNCVPIASSLKRGKTIETELLIVLLV